MKRNTAMLWALLVTCFLSPATAFAAEGGVGTGGGMVALGAGFAMAIAALGGTLAQGRAVVAALDSIGRNPSAAGKMLTPMVLGLVFIETLVIFSFVIAYLLRGSL